MILLSNLPMACLLTRCSAAALCDPAFFIIYNSLLIFLFSIDFTFFGRIIFFFAFLKKLLFGVAILLYFSGLVWIQII